MKEILFKAKRIDNGKWVYGYYMDRHGCEIIEKGTWLIFDVDENTICQYTGLTDKNGNKIWENDVALRNSSQGLFKGKIIYDKDGSLCHREFNTDFEALLIGSEKYIEVIGNIFDNPELMKEEQ